MKNRGTSTKLGVILAGHGSKKQQKKRFYDLSDRLAKTKDPGERASVKTTLAKMVFGE